MGTVTPLTKKKSRLSISAGKRAGLRYKDAVFVMEYIKDFGVRRAAEAAGYTPEHGYKLLERPDVREAIDDIITEQLEQIGIESHWLIYELVDNHRIARQQGNISASNTALKLLMQHAEIDAMAKKKIEMDVTTDKELLERLQRGREKMNKDREQVIDIEPVQDDKPVSFLCSVHCSTLSPNH